MASFSELLDLHYGTIYRIAWKWCRHRTNAEDITQHDSLPEEEPPAGGAGRPEDYIYLVQLLDQLDEIGEGMKETALLVRAQSRGSQQRQS